MAGLKTFSKFLIVAALLVSGIAFTLANWSWVFAKKVHGRILNVQRVTDPNSIISARVTEAQMHTYAILIQGDDGHLYTTASSNSQWETATKGFCVTALLYRYPPWELNRAGTFYNARLDDQMLCPGETEPPKDDAIPPKPAAENVPRAVPAPDDLPASK